ncbi:sulfatase-like hydrolase/transferase [Breznakia sp. OttesenSCG-928-G09]|nr:sulfatase-like hydrolase/transferase [Breznakia sp. OttesenSCG-928-G09]
MFANILLILISFILFYSASWALDYFGLSCFEQIVFHLKVPLEGTNTEFIFDWIKKCISKAVVSTLFICLPLLNENYKNNFFVISMILSVIFLLLAAKRVGLFGFIGNLFKHTELYEEEYIDGQNLKIEFPEKKKNLIYIYVESLENTYTSKDNGGNYSDDLLYPLSKYAIENINFSNTETLGGAKVVSGTGWTTGGMVAQSGGVPLLVPLNQKRFSKKTDFLPGLYALGDILEKEGYNQEYLIGSDAIFGGREFYFKKHGNYKIFDLNTAYEEKKIARDYKEFWGYEDEKLLSFAKEEILNLANENKPFNFTMLTVDTHHPYGYVCKNCDNKYPERLSNVIACNSKQIGELVEWITKQEFYKDTTLIITGDHLSMAAEYIHKTYDKTYERTIFNTFMNSSIPAANTTHRKFTSFDMFPTTLASMGVHIEGNRLGLGTNLFSSEKTLIEKYGFDFIDQELRKQSSYYKRNILKRGITK